MKKKIFKRRFAKRVLTRFHMSLILLATALSGLVFSKLLLIANLNNVIIRFIVVLIFAYICFFLLMKLWLIYLTTPYRKKRIGEDLIDTIEIVADSSDFSPSDSGLVVKGHGGEFGGGGVSGRWEPDDELAAISVSESVSNTAESVGETATEAASEAVSGLAEEGALILIPLAILLLAIFGGGVYLIYEAPAIISEAAFEFILATSLIKSARKMDKPDWLGSVFRSTWPAFVFTLVLTLILGFVVTSYCPQAIKLTEVVKYCL